MEYFAPTFWLLVTVLVAWGVHHVWSGMVRPEVFNTVLLPGTLVAQMGRACGLLMTGATIGKATFFRDDVPGTSSEGEERPKIPLVGPVLVALLPITACSVALWFLIRELGEPIMINLQTRIIGPTLPETAEGMWQLLRDQVTLVETTFAVIAQADFENWKTWLFLYLLVCLTTQFAPYSGNMRGSLGAVTVLGIAGSICLAFVDPMDARVDTGWAILNLIFATLLFLFMASLVLRCIVMLITSMRSAE